MSRSRGVVDQRHVPDGKAPEFVDAYRQLMGSIAADDDHSTATGMVVDVTA